MYNYQVEKPKIFTERGQTDFIKARDGVLGYLRNNPCIMMGTALQFTGTGDSWYLMALIDRMVEMGDIYEITKGCNVAGQHRTFIKS